MQKIKNILKRFFKKDGFIYKLISKVYHFLSTQKSKITHNKEIKEERKKYTKTANYAIEIKY